MTCRAEQGVQVGNFKEEIHINQKCHCKIKCVWNCPVTWGNFWFEGRKSSPYLYHSPWRAVIPGLNWQHFRGLI